jgi:hypothetical protein
MQYINLASTDAPLDGLQRRLILANLEYAVEQIEAIVEVKRVRKSKNVMKIQLDANGNPEVAPPEVAPPEVAPF